MYLVHPRQITELQHKNRAEDEERMTYKTGPQLTSMQQQETQKIINSYPDVFALDFEEIKMPRLTFQHDIKTGEHPPIKQHPYRIAPAYQQWVRDEIRKLEESDMI